FVVLGNFGHASVTPADGDDTASKKCKTGSF
ncbi:hypothetical protein A2U01_0068813, partial [Trifolium medium]|nr:hypothetical protein [Trifolium medium]